MPRPRSDVCESFIIVRHRRGRQNFQDVYYKVFSQRNPARTRGFVHRSSVFSKPPCCHGAEDVLQFAISICTQQL